MRNDYNLSDIVGRKKGEGEKVASVSARAIESIILLLVCISLCDRFRGDMPMI